MSILYPVSLAASLAFCPFIPIASDNCLSGTTTFASFVSGSANANTTVAGDKAFSMKIPGFSSHSTISIFSPLNSSLIAVTRVPFIPTHAPTGSTSSLLDHTAILVLEPASLAIALISTVPSATSATSCSKRSLTRSG